MKVAFLLYVLCLFIIFTPGIFFTLYKKNSVLSIIIHGILFAIVVYLSTQLLDKKIIEGNTYTLNVSDLSSLFGVKNTYDVSVDTELEKTSSPLSEEESLLQTNNAIVQESSKNTNTKMNSIVDAVKDEVKKIKGELTDYKFNAKKAKFVCTMELPNFKFSKPQLSSNTYQFYNSKTMVPGWNLNRAALLNNTESWGFKTPYPDGAQAIALQNTASISTILTLYPGSYFLKFLVSGRDCCDKTGIPNKIDLMLNDKVFDSVEPELTEWNEYTSKPFTIEEYGEYIVTFQGTNNEEINGIVDKSTAVKSIIVHRE